MLRLFSPAKINLFLHIVSKRSDGYHELSSLFQTITLGDRLTIELSDKDQLSCSDPQLPIDSTNLVLKATALFRKKTGLNPFFKIHLDKKIPIQAGLGGGSSNAATALWGCNLITKANLSSHTLKEWGRRDRVRCSLFLFPRDSALHRKGRVCHRSSTLSPAHFMDHQTS